MSSALALGPHQLPRSSNDRRHWGNLSGSGESLAIAQNLAAQSDFALIIVEDSNAAEKTYHELRFFLPAEFPVLLFPDWETLIYDSFSPHQDIISERLSILNRLPTMTAGALVVPASTIMQRVPPRAFSLGSSLVLETGQKFDITGMRRKLEASAYRCVETVLEHGEFAVRGSIMDIYPMGSDLPYRLDLFDDEIESLRTFDPETQLSIEKVSDINLLPAREFPLGDEDIRNFQDKWHQHFQVDPRNCAVYQDVSQGISPAGVEYYLPLFFDELESLFDYLPEQTLVFTSDVEDIMNRHWQDASNRYENLRYDVQRPILAPEDILIPADVLFSHANKRPRIKLNQHKSKGDNLDFQDLPDIAINDRLQRPLSDLAKFISNNPETKILIVTESNGRREVVDELLDHNGLGAKGVESWDQAIEADDILLLSVASLER